LAPAAPANAWSGDADALNTKSDFRFDRVNQYRIPMRPDAPVRCHWYERNIDMTKTILMATAMIVALNSFATASELRNHPHHVAFTSVQQAPENSVFASPEPTSQSEAHQYHGGPKAND
jgi:hypothetical protein